MSSFYNCSICFYYLSIITFNKKDDYIKHKLEPWFHGVPIIWAIVIGITGLIMKQLNVAGAYGGICHLTNYHPPHCRGVENGIIPEGFTVPCGRGDTDSGNLFTFILYLLPITIVSAIIVGSMTIMYRTVRKIERKMLNYGAGALRLRTHQRQEAQVVDDNYTCLSIFLVTLKNKLVSICPCVFRNDSASRSNNARSQKRAVLYMAMGYSLTIILIWVPFYIIRYAIYNRATGILQVLYPLQGLYTLIVYMSPKVRHARNTRRGKLPWRQAIAKACMSKGEKDRATFGRRDTRASSLWQHLQSCLSLFMNRQNERSSAALTSSSKASASGGTIHPPSTVHQN